MGLGVGRQFLSIVSNPREWNLDLCGTNICWHIGQRLNTSVGPSMKTEKEKAERYYAKKLLNFRTTIFLNTFNRKGVIKIGL